MKTLKVMDLINKLNEIGYDKNTELTFSCVDGETGECYDIDFDEITYGENLTGQPYCNDVIDIGIDVDSAKEYIQAKSESMLGNLINDLDEVLERHRPW